MKIQKNSEKFLETLGLNPYDFIALSYVPYAIPFPHFVKGLPGEHEVFPFGNIPEKIAQKVFNSCLQKGLIKIVTKKVLIDIRKYLKKNNLPMPIYGLPSLNSVDFTLKGSKTYYKACRKIYGPDLRYYQIQKKGFEIYFFPSKNDAYNIIKHLDPELIGPIERIGPWCSSWWEKFPFGYRVKMKLPKKSPELILTGPEGRRFIVWFNGKDWQIKPEG